jgi:hypothetical protein
MINKSYLLILLLLLPFGLCAQSQAPSFSLLNSLEAMKKERVSAQNDFFTSQRKLVVKLDSKITPSEAEVAQCIEAIKRVQNLRYSFGLDAREYCRIYFPMTSNQSQNKIGKAEMENELGKLFSYKLKTDSPLTKKDLDEVALCLRSMFNILRLDVSLRFERDQEIMYRLGYGR